MKDFLLRQLAETPGVNPIQSHPNYDHESLRILLPFKQAKRLPIKLVTQRELFDVMTTWEYNPAFFYDYKLGKDIVGQDLQYRYKVKNN